MTATSLPDVGPSGCVQAQTVRPDSAFTSVAYHFGMLLGVEDFETEQGYHRGKMRLHNGWLHGAGVVWGYDVSADPGDGEVRVDRGLALDPAGRELYLPVPACLDVARWYERHAADPDLRAVVEETDDAIHFPAHIELHYCECLARQVPALADPCEGADSDTAYSRAHETVELRLVPGPAPALGTSHRLLRILFGLEAGDPAVASEAAAVAAREAVITSPAADRVATLLDAFRTLVVDDTLASAPPLAPDGDPPMTLPARDDAALTIATLAKVELKKLPGGGLQLNAADVDMARRLSLIPTAVIQELLCGLFPGGGPDERNTSPSHPQPAADAGGPRVKPDTVKRTVEEVTFQVTKALLRSTVEPDAFSTTSLTNAGWLPIEVSDAFSTDDGLNVTVRMGKEPGNGPLRLIVSGTGPTPLLGADLVPFAGGPDSPPGRPDDGNDFVLMIEETA